MAQIYPWFQFYLFEAMKIVFLARDPYMHNYYIAILSFMKIIEQLKIAINCHISFRRRRMQPTCSVIEIENSMALHKLVCPAK